MAAADGSAALAIGGARASQQERAVNPGRIDSQKDHVARQPGSNDPAGLLEVKPRQAGKQILVRAVADIA